MNPDRKVPARQRILDVVDRLFYTEGVRATGTERIMAMADVAKATFYHHFESKDTLVLAYPREARSRSLGVPVATHKLARGSGQVRRMGKPPLGHRLPVLRVAVPEYPDPAHPFHQFAIKHQDKIRDCLANLLDASISDKKAAAAALLSVVDGALTFRMLYGISQRLAWSQWLRLF